MYCSKKNYISNMSFNGMLVASHSRFTEIYLKLIETTEIKIKVMSSIQFSLIINDFCDLLQLQTSIISAYKNVVINLVLLHSLTSWLRIQSAILYVFRLLSPAHIYACIKPPNKIFMNP